MIGDFQTRSIPKRELPAQRAPVGANRSITQYTVSSKMFGKTPSLWERISSSTSEGVIKIVVSYAHILAILFLILLIWGIIYLTSVLRSSKQEALPLYQELQVEPQ